MKNVDVIGNAVRRQLVSMFGVYRNTDDLNKFRVLKAIKCLAKTFIQIRRVKRILTWSDELTTDIMFDRFIIDDTI